MAYISPAAIINSILPKSNPVNMEMCPIPIAVVLLTIPVFPDAKHHHYPYW